MVCYYFGLTHTTVLINTKGLFDQSGRPVFPNGMTIAAHTTTYTFKNHLKTPRMVILKFVLEDLSDSANISGVLYLSLLCNYTKDKREALHHEKIIFNLSNDGAIANHEKLVSKSVDALILK